MKKNLSISALFPSLKTRCNGKKVKDPTNGIFVDECSTNPYLPSYEYIPDAEPHVFGKRLYIFGSHDKFNGKEYCENDYVIYSAPIINLTNFTNTGIVYRREEDPTPVEKFKNRPWAPDCVKGSDGRYYIYYGLEWDNRIAVAVSNTPDGKYEYYGEVKYKDGTRYGGRKNERIRFDPAVLNDDGNIYLYTGFSSDHAKRIEKHAKIKITAEGSTVVKLGSDMLTIIEGPKDLLPGKRNSKGSGFEGHEFYEAMSMRKFNGNYYAIYSSVLSHELCYAISKYPDRDFKFIGTLHSNGGIYNGSKATFYWGNNHGSIEKIGSKYYVFGHRQTNRNESSRQGIVEEIVFDGEKFSYAEMTSMGLMNKPLSIDKNYQFGIACVLMSKKGAKKITKAGKKDPYITQDGLDREEDGFQYIANFQDGCVTGFKYFYFDRDSVEIKITVINHYESKMAIGKLQVSTDINFRDYESIDIVIKEKREISLRLNSIKGIKPLYVRYIGKGALNLMKISFK